MLRRAHTRLLSHSGFPNQKATNINFLSYPCRQRVSLLPLSCRRSLCSLLSQEATGEPRVAAATACPPRAASAAHRRARARSGSAATSPFARRQPPRRRPSHRCRRRGVQIWSAAPSPSWVDLGADPGLDPRRIETDVAPAEIREDDDSSTSPVSDPLFPPLFPAAARRRPPRRRGLQLLHHLEL